MAQFPDAYVNNLSLEKLRALRADVQQRSQMAGRHGEVIFRERLAQIDQAEARHRAVVVYFIGAGKRVKIGSSRDPDRRLKALQTGHPERLVLIGTMPGGRAKELELHKKFARYAVGGEWFRRIVRLRRFIEKHCGAPAP